MLGSSARRATHTLRINYSPHNKETAMRTSQFFNPVPPLPNMEDQLFLEDLSIMKRQEIVGISGCTVHLNRHQMGLPCECDLRVARGPKPERAPRRPAKRSSKRIKQ